MPFIAAHASNLLFAARHKYGFLSAPPVFEPHCDSVLVHVFQEHSHRHLIKGLHFIQKAARAIQSNERKPFFKLRQNFRSMVAEEMLPRSSLPVEVIGEVDVPGQVRLFKSNHLFVFIKLHEGFLVRKANAISSSEPWIDARKVAACNPSDDRMVQPSEVRTWICRCWSNAVPHFLKPSFNVQT